MPIGYEIMFIYLLLAWTRAFGIGVYINAKLILLKYLFHTLNPYNHF